MLLATSLLLASAATVQEPGPIGGEAPPVVWTKARNEAPRQPQGVSRSSYERKPRRRLQSIDHGREIRHRSKIRNIMGVRGMETNTVGGIGLVTGLANTGDSGEAALQIARNKINDYGLPVELSDLSGNNIAIVRVEAEIPAGIKPGRRVHVRVSTYGDAKSLQGGTLMFTELFDAQMENVYATASGPITVGGSTADGEAASVVKNHPTVGTMAFGAKIEREIPTQIVDESGYFYLDAKIGQDTLANVVAVRDAIEQLFPGLAQISRDGKTVRVALPSDLHEADTSIYADTILQLEVETHSLPRVVINERTGVVVMGGDIRLKPGLVSHGSITVTISETPEASQPAPFSDGQTVVLPRTDVSVIEEDRALTYLPPANTLSEVMDVLNVLGATPRDLIQILQALSEGGYLEADIHRM